MLRLFLLRHAKSSWSDPSLRDFDRPLNKRGMKDAPKIGQAMKERGYTPDRILCSSAQRTRETLAGIIPSLNGEVSLHLLDSLYEGNAPDYLVLLRQHAKASKNLLVVGHNTGLQDIAIQLVGDGDFLLRSDLETKFPTGALAVLDFDCNNWSKILGGTGTLVDFIKPRDLSSGSEPILVKNPAPTFLRR